MIKPTCPKCGGHDITMLHHPSYQAPLLGMLPEFKPEEGMRPVEGPDEWVCCDDMAQYTCDACDHAVNFWGAFFPELEPGTVRLRGHVKPGTMSDDPAVVV